MGSPSRYIVTPLAATTPVSDYTLQQFRTLRLDALRSDPLSFFSDYEHEIGFTDEEWATRIADPSKHHLICEYVRHHTDEGEKSELGGLSSCSQSAWVGMFTFHGSLSQRHYDFKSRQGPCLSGDEEETRWFLSGLYLQSKHRGTEVNTAIHEAVLDYIRVQTDELLVTEWDELSGLEKPKNARILGVLRSQNPTLRELYQALGAYEVGVINGSEALKLAGNNDELVDVQNGKIHREQRVAMELVMAC